MRAGSGSGGGSGRRAKRDKQLLINGPALALEAYAGCRGMRAGLAAAGNAGGGIAIAGRRVTFRVVFTPAEQTNKISLLLKETTCRTI